MFNLLAWGTSCVKPSLVLNLLGRGTSCVKPATKSIPAILLTQFYASVVHCLLCYYAFFNLIHHQKPFCKASSGGVSDSGAHCAIVERIKLCFISTSPPKLPSQGLSELKYKTQKACDIALLIRGTSGDEDSLEHLYSLLYLCTWRNRCKALMQVFC